MRIQNFNVWFHLLKLPTKIHLAWKRAWRKARMHAFHLLAVVHPRAELGNVKFYLPHHIAHFFFTDYCWLSSKSPSVSKGTCKNSHFKKLCYICCDMLGYVTVPSWRQHQKQINSFRCNFCKPFINNLQQILILTLKTSLFL